MSLSPSVGYIHEPFNPRHATRFCGARFDRWFQYVCDENEHLYLKSMESFLDFKFHFFKELKSAKSLNDIGKLTTDHAHFTANQLLKKRALVKDPIALFSVDWLAKRFNMDVVMLVRHPAAFAGSLKQAGWTHPFNHFLDQPLLMDHHLSQYKSEIEEYSIVEKDVVSQAILLWNLINHMILKYQDNNPDWLFIKHEDLSRDPLTEFPKIYNRLGLNFSTSVEEKMKEYCFPNLNGVDSVPLKRNSKSNISNWKKQLTQDEICRIKDKTYEVASKFYTEEDWA